MTVKVQIGPDVATISHHHWTSKNKQLARTLNAMLRPVGPSDPAPDYHAAEKAVEALGGKIVKADLPEYEHVEGRVY